MPGCDAFHQWREKEDNGILCFIRNTIPTDDCQDELIIKQPFKTETSTAKLIPYRGKLECLSLSVIYTLA